ncbi:MAG: ATPase [Rhodobacteraceae bacterium]|nr:ATPase [Paracoccaceae bacterium]
MGESNSHNVVGIDGGGTSCRIGLLARGEFVQVQTGPANVTTDLERALANISQGLRDVADKAGLALEAVSKMPAFVGLAGVLDAKMANCVARGLPLTDARVADDRISMLAGALGGQNGTVAGIGTGSFLARQSDLGVQLIGGHGFVLGDDASGAWMGRRLLAHCLLVQDGIASATGLSAAALDHFGGQPKHLIEFARHAAPKDFGALAPQVLSAARDGDAAGLAIVRRGVEYVVAGLDALGWTRDEALCMTGGLGPHYARFLPDEVATAVVQPRGTALDGAILLAQRMAGETMVRAQ